MDLGLNWSANSRERRVLGKIVVGLVEEVGRGTGNRGKVSDLIRIDPIPWSYGDVNAWSCIVGGLLDT